MDGSGLHGWKWITRMEVDYMDGSGLHGWKWITWMEVDFMDGSGLPFIKFDFVTGRAFPWLWNFNFFKKAKFITGVAI